MNRALRRQMRKVEDTTLVVTLPEMNQATIIEIEDLTRRVRSCFNNVEEPKVASPTKF